MKKILFFGIIMFTFFDCLHSQENRSELNQGFQFIVKNFKVGNYHADLMTGSENNERRIELTYKMLNAVRNDYDWYVEFVKDAPNGFPVEYNERLGLTEEEYKELRSILDNYRMASELEFNFKIEEDNSILQFISQYENELFNGLKIDLNKQEVKLGSYNFTLTDTVLVSDENNRMGSKWRGYQWTYQVPDKIDFSNVADLVGKDAVLYRINFGILEPSNMLYLSIKGVEIEDGEQKVSFVIPVFMEKKF